MLAATHDWRLPLLEWLVEQVEQAETGGDSAEVVRLRRRIAVVQLQALQQSDTASTPNNVLVK